GRYWAFSKQTLNKYINDGKIVVKEKYSEKERGFIFKRYKNELKTIYNPVNSLKFIENQFMHQTGTKELKSIFDEKMFDDPKPIFFINNLIKYSMDKEDIILDFFSGFRVIIVIEANSYVNIRSSRLLPKFKTQKINSWCA